MNLLSNDRFLCFKRYEEGVDSGMIFSFWPSLSDFGNCVLAKLRCEMAWRKVESVKEHQKLLLKALNVFDDICKSNNINYSLAYGTMLGAVRHKGFIPWDDDVDVLMVRSEYERFERAFAMSEYAKKYDLWGIHDKDNYFVGYVGKFFDKNTKLIERLKREVVYGVYVDIFVIDELPRSKMKQKCFLTAYRYLSRLLQILSRRANLFDRLHKFVRISPDFHMVKKLVDLLLKHKGDGGDYSVTSCIIGWGFDKVIIPRKCIDGYAYVEFEGKKFQVFSKWDELLRLSYGEYWIVPPEGQRQSHSSEVYVEE